MSHPVSAHHPNEAHLEGWHEAYSAAATADRADLAAFGPLWPLAYLAVASPARALADAAALAELTPKAPYVAMVDDAPGRPRFTIAMLERPLSLGEVLPPLQSLGLEVLFEEPFRLTRPDGVECWLYDFVLSPGDPVGEPARAPRRIEQAFLALWAGRVEIDPFNRLVTTAGLSWLETALLRAYGQYMHQLGVPWGRTFTAAVLADHPMITRQLSELFHRRFVDGRPADAGLLEDLRSGIEASIDEVENLNADRVLRGYLSLVLATVRTNYYGPNGLNPAGAIALKFDPRRVNLVPQPRPRFEVFVSSPRLEGIHLRFGPVARGGLRWSDRYEDLRTEILGLATAQVAKNAVIVPTGAKGGFVVKRPTGHRAPLTSQDALAGYREFVSALLDVHDNVDPRTGKVIPTPGTVAYEGQDPYLVVAADKGTAAFSDTANSIAIERDFWLGDAFASGGSAGYDHKAMGITARGAWCSVRRHFAELGIDPAADGFTVVGIGDMSGDVFGNGMLLSATMSLVAAFDHRHIFLDPNPEPAIAHAERQRLFDLGRSTWADYDPELISPGGGVFARTAKAIPITDPVRRRLGLPADTTSLTPAELVSAVLAAPVDLLWNGGVGTYVKAGVEHDTDAGDKVNDSVRIDAYQVRARVVGEGGNLGFTQRGRIEYARAGGRINTDALDNSAGVGSSDREVNIKIALQQLVRQGMPESERLALLGAMTEDVAALVLAENIAQNELLGQCRQFAPDELDLHSRLIDDLEQRRDLNRTHLALPTPAQVTVRRRDGQGLCSPELAVLIAQVKLDLRTTLLAGDLPDDPATHHFLTDYFPARLRADHPAAIDTHPLRREIIATEIVNTVVDNAGLGWVHRMLETSTTATAEDVVRAYLITADVFELPDLWRRIRGGRISTQVAGDLITESIRIIDRASRWLLQHRPQPLHVTAEITRLRPTVADLSGAVPGWHEGSDHIDYLHRLNPVVTAGADPELAATIFGLLERFCLLDIAEIAYETGHPAEQVAPLYYLVKERREIDRVLTGISGLPRNDRWTALARLGLRDDLYESIRWIVTRILTDNQSHSRPGEALADWEQRVGARLAKIQSVVAASRTGQPELAALAVAARQIRTLALLTNQPSPVAPRPIS